jgi:hypothetical protein
LYICKLKEGRAARGCKIKRSKLAEKQFYGACEKGSEAAAARGKCNARQSEWGSTSVILGVGGRAEKETRKGREGMEKIV